MRYYKNITSNEVYAYEDNYVPSNNLNLVRMTEVEVDMHLSSQLVVVNPADVARRKRDALLTENIDSISPLYWDAINQVKKDEWVKYRQALLDITKQIDFPLNVLWPVKPER